MEIIEDIVSCKSSMTLDDCLILLSKINQGQGNTFYLLESICRQCQKILGYALINQKQQSILYVKSECTRVVLGIDPRVRSAMMFGINYGQGNPDFICYDCHHQIPALIGTAIPEVRERLESGDRFIDLPKFNEGGGCWVTVKEFQQKERYELFGLFVNVQLGLPGFKRVVETTGLDKLLKLN